ncbi:hypothetical protein ACWGI8_24225 [Streptomyces sp. NPDC054841]
MPIRVALLPPVGVTAQIATWMAELINTIPPDVLAAIGTGIAVIALAVKTSRAWSCPCTR